MISNADHYTPHVYDNLILRFRRTPADQLPQRWRLLEAAHVVGQTRLGPHLQVHGLMLALAWETRTAKEMLGQLFRIALVPLGHLLGRLPLGNSGRAHISAFQPMQPSTEILQTIAESRSPKPNTQNEKDM